MEVVGVCEGPALVCNQPTTRAYYGWLMIPSLSRALSIDLVNIGEPQEVTPLFAISSKAQIDIDDHQRPMEMPTLAIFLGTGSPMGYFFHGDEKTVGQSLGIR